MKKLGLIAYKRLESKLDTATWCTDPTKSHLQYWPQDLHSVITKTADDWCDTCLLYTSPSPRDRQKSRMPSSA